MGIPQDPRRAGRAGLGVKVGAPIVWEILKANGIGPAPRRTRPTWSQFLRSQAEAILACDFFSVDLHDGAQAHVLTMIEHATRRIRILGVTLYPTNIAWSRDEDEVLGTRRAGPVHPADRPQGPPVELLVGAG
jgi:hypothetical protein